VPDKWFALKPDNQRIEELLHKECSAVSVVCRKTKGRKRKMLDDKVYRLSILRGDIETTDSLKTELGIINEVFEEFKEKYNDLEKEKNTLYEEIILEVNKLKQEVCDLKYVNKELMDYIDTLEKKDSLQCQGNKLQDVGKKQQTRKLRHLRSKAECALWFCESFGLKLSNIKLKDDTGASYSLDYTHPLLVS
jgi:predicted nuclease with TOPRIM domain